MCVLHVCVCVLHDCVLHECMYCKASDTILIYIPAYSYTVLVDRQHANIRQYFILALCQLFFFFFFLYHQMLQMQNI